MAGSMAVEMLAPTVHSFPRGGWFSFPVPLITILAKNFGTCGSDARLCGHGDVYQTGNSLLESDASQLRPGVRADGARLVAPETTRSEAEPLLKGVGTWAQPPEHRVGFLCSFQLPSDCGQPAPGTFQPLSGTQEEEGWTNGPPTQNQLGPCPQKLLSDSCFPGHRDSARFLLRGWDMGSEGPEKVSRL